MALSPSDRAAVTFTLVGVWVGIGIGATATYLITHGVRTCRLDEQQLARLTPPVPVAAIAAPAPAPAAPVPVAAAAAAVVTPAEPPPASWRVDELGPFVWTNRDGFALRGNLTMTHLRAAISADPLRVKTTCTVGERELVEFVGFAPPPGDPLIGETAIGSFVDPFYWNPLKPAPSRCDLRFFADGADAGRFCVTIEPLSVVREACPVLLEAPLPTAP